jgi:tetratricopeptide (TPR) repeat protein
MAAMILTAGAPAARAAEPSPRPAAGTDSLAAPELRFRLAIGAFARGDWAAVADLLLPLDPAAPGFAHGGRALVLLRHACRELGPADLPGRLSPTPTAGPAAALEAWLAGREAAGGEDEDALAGLAAGDTTDATGRDLAAAAAIRLATLRLGRGEDPRALLATVPRGGRFGTRALHLAAAVSLERGDVDAGRRLAAEVAGDPAYPARRDALLALAGAALDAGDGSEARRRYEEADADWVRQREALAGLRAGGNFEPLWREWSAAGEVSDAILVDGPALRARDAARAAAAADLSTAWTPAAGEAPAAARVPAPAGPWRVPPPPGADRDSLDAAARRIAGAEFEHGRALRRAAREEADLADLRRHLAVGRSRLAGERDSLDERVSRLDSLAAAAAEFEARLLGARDTAVARVARRVEALVERASANAAWLAAMRHFHADGPGGQRWPRGPAGHPDARAALAAEDSLWQEIADLARRVGDGTPGRIAASWERHWRPGLIARVALLAARADSARGRVAARIALLDSAAAAAVTSGALRAQLARADSCARAADSLRRVHAGLRDALARAAVERTWAEIESEREAIDYGLAVSACAGVARPDPSAATAAAPAAADTTRDDAATVSARRLAIAEARRFLERHPGSQARGEMRFRLADLLLLEARHEFRERMARRLAAGPESASGPPPVIENEPALELYRAILAEDAAFPHRDAVLFHAGMLLADEGAPAAAGHLDELVTSHPSSPHVQEARLRLGDLEFEQRDFDRAVAHYREATDGPEAGLGVVALYKLGWALHNQERHREAAGAYAAVLDRYAGPGRVAIHVDVEREAAADLVRMLAFAGGAPACAEHFDRAGTRPYERRVLLDLGEYLRGHGRPAEAAAVDELCLARHPLAPEALLAAERLVATHQLREDAPRARAARLEHGPRFAPGSAWQRAQASDSLAAAGSRFARASLRAVAVHHHQLGRAKGRDSDWREALGLYERILALWPDDADAGRIELGAGEASARLGEPVRALAHYAAAAASPGDSVARAARWQRFVVTDAWYERSRAGGDPGSDSLARATIAEGDAVLAHAGGSPEAADVLWRQGHLAFAHGWFERSSSAFGRLAASHPADARAPAAAAAGADALFRLGRFGEAGAAFEVAQRAAAASGRDSLARAAARAVPVCYLRHAEALAARDTADATGIARAFSRVAEGWPAYEHAHIARYRAALAWLRAGRPRDAIRELGSLVADHSGSEYVADARLQIARAWKAAGDTGRAAEAYLDFAARHPGDDGARAAWLESADLFEAAGRIERADELRIAYLDRHPDDVAAGFEILEPLARRELDALGPGRPVSVLLPPARPARSRRPPGSRLAAYLRLADSQPALASRELLARARFLQGEEAAGRFGAIRLTQPLDAAITQRQQQLDEAVARYREAIDHGAAPWAGAAAFRIGEMLVGFGDAVLASERPADLKADDLAAYEEVIAKQAQALHDRGEQVWEDLLRGSGTAGPVAGGSDPWIERARANLWRRLGGRFAFRPEAAFPLVEPGAPPQRRGEGTRPGAETGGTPRAQHGGEEER